MYNTYIASIVLKNHVSSPGIFKSINSIKRLLLLGQRPSMALVKKYKTQNIKKGKISLKIFSRI